jgi:hypothetical protein
MSNKCLAHLVSFYGNLIMSACTHNVWFQTGFMIIAGISLYLYHTTK